MRLALRMSTFDNDRLQRLACVPAERAQMETVLRDAREAIAKARWSLARGALTREVRRLQRALDNPGIPA